jgi:DNA gyrase inhibitor GyrI
MLEQAVGSMRGRRFIAAFDPLQGWYRACVEVRVEMTHAERELAEMVIPGGRYLRVRLRGDPPEVYDEIAAAYALLESSANRDDSRPSLERYRRLDEIDVLMPVTEPPSLRSRL